MLCDILQQKAGLLEPIIRDTEHEPSQICIVNEINKSKRKT